jgi:hypothetical protein
MGRPGLTRHRKFLRLARDLNRHYQGLGVLLARGVLESMWDAAYESGDPFVGGADDVEDAVRWPGPAGVCCEALLSAGGEGRAGFIEAVTGGGYIIHDLWDHAPDYVRKRHAREREREERGAALALTGQRPVGDQSVTGQCPPSPDSQDENGRTPAPAPTQKEYPVSRRRRGAEDQEGLSLATYLRAAIERNTPDARLPRSLGDWAETFRLMRDRDHRTPEDIRRVIDWATADSFWRANMFSAAKLRDKFDTLKGQMMHRGRGQQPTGENGLVC